MAKGIIYIGAVVMFVGLLLMLFGENKLNWFGNLIGDFKYENENFKFYFPFVSMIIVSLVFSFLINIFYKIFK